MKLQELAATKPTSQIAKVFESYFGSKMSFDQLTRTQARTMLTKVRTALGETRRQPSFHQSERNPAYLKMMMMEQALASRLAETMPGMPAAPAAPTAPKAPITSTVAGKPPVDPKLAAAQDKIKKGQTLSPEEQKMVNDNAAAVAESRLRRAYRYLKESEVQQAQVVLAAQDMVDKMQGMLEDVSELQFKELPALVESIKNQVGIDQANQFNQDATAALSGLLQNIQGAKQQLDAALGVVTGQTPPGGNIGADMGAAAGNMGAAAGDMAAADMAAPGPDLEAGDDLEEPGAPAAPAALGRARR